MSEVSDIEKVLKEDSGSRLKKARRHFQYS